MVEFSPYDFDDRLFFIGAALLANLLLGSYALHKAFMLGALGAYLRRLLGNLERRLNRSHRSQSERAVRGTIVLLVVVALTGVVAAALSALTATHHLGFVAEVVLLALFIPQRLIYAEVAQLLSLLKKDRLHDARKLAEKLSLRDVRGMDKHAIVRTAIEHLANSFAVRVLSPIIWYLLLGLPGFVASKIITEAALLLGYESRRHRAYGKTPGRLETVINFFPARLAGWIMVLASCFVPKARPLRALGIMQREQELIHPPRKGAPIAAAAGALGVSLAGPRSVQGFLVKDGWVGKGSAKAGLQDMQKMLLLYAISCLINLAVIATLLFALAR